MTLTDFHMLKSFLAASACSALIVIGANRSGYANLSHRTDSSYGWFMKYDANIIGGLLQGIGMTLTGSCPGSVLVQLGLGIKSAPKVALGCILGGLAFAKLGHRLKRPSPPCAETPTKHTIQEQTGLSTNNTILIYEAMCFLMIIAANLLAPAREYWLNPIIGGVLIGIAQATSVLFTYKTLGVSSAWQDVGKYIWSIVEGSKGPGLSNIIFASGVVAGTKIISQYIPITAETGTGTTSLAAIVGGFLLIFGARLAGGCTSGHGISGMATMSLSSFITVACMFAGGISSATLLQ
jgi:uncharacterized membrane protein YedE/YeeE